tara:strand:+ start:614 stop:1171 length:558 start_codon:yes stop_codon:yes gene_type:complete
MGIEPIPSPLQYNSNEMINMPYKHCLKIMEDGHRCNAQFFVPTNLHPLRFCPEHENPKGRNLRKRHAETERLHDFVVELQTTIPKMKETLRTLQLENSKMLTRIDDLEVLLNEETAVKTINKAKTDLESLKEELKTNKEQIDTYFESMIMDIRKVEKENAIGESDFAKLQRQITTLGNRVRKLQE